MDRHILFDFIPLLAGECLFCLIIIRFSRLGCGSSGRWGIGRMSSWHLLSKITSVQLSPHKCPETKSIVTVLYQDCQMSLILQACLLLIHPASWSHDDFMQCESDHISAPGRRKHIQSSGTRTRKWSCLRKSGPCMPTSHGLLENSGSDKGLHIPQPLQGRLLWWEEKWKGTRKKNLKI